MKIKDETNKPNHLPEFADLTFGDAFKIPNTNSVYMRLAVNSEEDTNNAVSLGHGSPTRFKPRDTVIPVDAEVILRVKA